MQDESVYGLVYKFIREERGFTQKKAAGITVTPHFLRQFEQGKSRITIQKFDELLSNIGIDKETFDILKMKMFPSEFHKLQTQVANLAYKREYKKILSLINKPLENPGVSEHYVIANRVVNKFAIANIIGNSFLTSKDYQELEYIKNYLSELDNWNKIEVKIFSSIIPHFSIEFLDYKLYHLLNTLKKQTEYHSTRTADYYIDCMRTSIKHYSVNGYYDKAENLALKTLEVINTFPLLSAKMVDMIGLSMERANNFLRQDDIRGLEIAKHIFAVLDNFEKIYPNHLLIRMREDFFATVTQLNHTGQPLDV